ncbi:hypothetical protein [Enorma phocaeensis]|uniref:hypothetical protein n=1 Tax=Enorma phocaeensis TaxID=1871019 RepID=UPI0011AEE01D|nr:hypothetical protein [Enorma phocaeensis]
MSEKITARPVSVSAILGGDIRLEASTYLRDGYGLTRLARQTPGCSVLGELADIWQPSRLAGYEMPAGKGLPFMTAGQVFEDFPRVRKWLAKPFVSQEQSRYVDSSWLLLSCSGVVGKVTAVYPHHLGVVVTHDLLRIVPKDEREYGWLYAYLKTDFFMKVAQAAQYGHMIKHIEVAHAKTFPVIMPEDVVRSEIGSIAVAAIERRTRAWQLRDEAFKLFEELVGWDSATAANASEWHGSFRVSDIFKGRQRLDAGYYNGPIARIQELFAGHPTSKLSDVTTFASDLPRFARTYGESGMPYVSASELFDVNAKPTKMIYAKLIRGWERYVLHDGMIVMACSGQKYGILGRSLMLTENHEGLFGSHDLLRIVVNPCEIMPGYLLTFLNDPVLGRPYVVRNAYGTSIPHLDPSDIQAIRIPRLEEANENRIANLMDESVRLSAEADRMENEAVRRAQEQIDLSIGVTPAE